MREAWTWKVCYYVLVFSILLILSISIASNVIIILILYLVARYLLPSNDNVSQCLSTDSHKQ